MHECDHHESCLSEAMGQLEAYCHDNDLRLTPLRRRVFELVWASHKPAGAYQLLEGLTEDGRKPSPPTVYRSLDFLLEHGLIHRIASLNAFLGCAHPGHPHPAQFFICRECGEATEVEGQALDQALDREAEDIGFDVQETTVEVLGRCSHCRADNVENNGP
ncbi:MAG: Fur family transcriptional regulator [Gammaproteobacteria bacterium]